MMMVLMPWRLTLLAAFIMLTLAGPAGQPDGGGATRTQESLTADWTLRQVIGDSRSGRPLTRQNKPRTEQNMPALPGMRSPINSHVNDGPVEDIEGEEPMNDKENLAVYKITGWENRDTTNVRSLTRQNKPRTEQNMPPLLGMRSPISSHVNDGPVNNNEGEKPVNKKAHNTDGKMMAAQRKKRVVISASKPPRRRVRPPQPNCTGCYSSLNLQSDPSGSAEPDASE